MADADKKLSKADQQVVKDEKTAEVAYQKDQAKKKPAPPPEPEPPKSTLEP